MATPQAPEGINIYNQTDKEYNPAQEISALAKKERLAKEKADRIKFEEAQFMAEIEDTLKDSPKVRLTSQGEASVIISVEWRSQRVHLWALSPDRARKRAEIWLRKQGYEGVLDGETI